MTTDPPFDLGETDRLLSTTRAVRKRLDFDRPVSDQTIFDCIDLAEQAPTGGNDSSRRWLVIRDEATKQRLGDICHDSGRFMSRIGDAPVLVIAAIWGIHDNSGRPGLFDSVIQAAWSFNLALRSRGLGTTWTTLLNSNVDQVAEVLAIPPGVTTIVTFPVAHTRGTDFGSATRRPAEEITYFDRWGYTRSRASAEGTVQLGDLQGVVTEIDIEAGPDAVWPALCDITVPARFSTEFMGAEWTSGPVGPGATFVGHNQMGDFEWEVECHVTDYIEGEVFEWSTLDPADPGAVWRLEVAPLGAGARLRFSMRIGTANNRLVAMVIDDPDHEAALINGRRRHLKANMQATIEGIKAGTESGNWPASLE